MTTVVVVLEALSASFYHSPASACEVGVNHLAVMYVMVFDLLSAVQAFTIMKRRVHACVIVVHLEKSNVVRFQPQAEVLAKLL